VRGHHLFVILRPCEIALAADEKQGRPRAPTIARARVHLRREDRGARSASAMIVAISPPESRKLSGVIAAPSLAVAKATSQYSVAFGHIDNSSPLLIRVRPARWRAVRSLVELTERDGASSPQMATWSGSALPALG